MQWLWLQKWNLQINQRSQMTTKEALKKVTSICFSHLYELKKEEEQMKDIDKIVATTLAEEQQQLSKALNIVKEFVLNSFDDGK